MSILRPRTIRGQLMRGLIVFEVLVLAFLSVVLINQQQKELHSRTARRLEYQAGVLAVQASVAMGSGQIDGLQHVVDAMRAAPSIRAVQITDVAGPNIAEQRSGA